MWHKDPQFQNSKEEVPTRSLWQISSFFRGESNFTSVKTVSEWIKGNMMGNEKNLLARRTLFKTCKDIPNLQVNKKTYLKNLYNTSYAYCALANNQNQLIITDSHIKAWIILLCWIITHTVDTHHCVTSDNTLRQSIVETLWLVSQAVPYVLHSKKYFRFTFKYNFFLNQIHDKALQCVVWLVFPLKAGVSIMSTFPGCDLASLVYLSGSCTKKAKAIWQPPLEKREGWQEKQGWRRDGGDVTFLLPEIVFR